jgi:membrane-bound inhibitor of C-type lysozyme
MPGSALRSAAVAFAALAVTGCASLFSTKEIERSRVPANATEYRCDAGRSFFLRRADASAWIILPEREFRLDKAQGAGERYASRVATLELKGDEATLVDGDLRFDGCKVAPPQK